MGVLLRVRLPVLSRVTVMRDLHEANHWLWCSHFGWHDCTPEEDAIINRLATKVAA